MEKFIKENWFKLGILIVVLVIGIFYFSNYKNSDTQILAAKAKCAEDGKKFVSQNFIDVMPDIRTTSKTFAYSTELKTCLANIESTDPLGFHYEIYDIYMGLQPIAYYSISNPELGRTDSKEDQKAYFAAKNKYFPQ